MLEVGAGWGGTRFAGIMSLPRTLIQAAKHGMDEEVTRFLIEGAPTDEVDSKGRSALHHAHEQGRGGMLQRAPERAAPCAKTKAWPHATARLLAPTF